MLSLQQKIFLSYLIVFLFCLIMVFPYSAKSVRSAIRNILEKRTDQLIVQISKSSSPQGMIETLNHQTHLVFFRVTLLSTDGRVLYESHVDKAALPLYKKHPEIEEAIKHRSGYHEDYSYHFGEQFAYIAKSFSFQGRPYILRTAFPLTQIQDLTQSFKLVLIKFGIAILVLFSVITWTIINLLTRPIRMITNAIKPYREGEPLPKIQLEKKRVTRDFEQLAGTFNSLSERIQQQIETLKRERNETGTILNSLSEGVLTTDHRMNVTYANERALEMFHLREEELIGRHISKINCSECYNMVLACREKNQTIYDTLPLKTETKIPVGVVVTPRGKQGEEGVMVVLQDKTHLHQILDMGKAFITNASHELTTPITVIRGFAETLHDYPDFEPARRSLITEKIVANCRRMESLIKNLLMLADIENLPRSQLQPCRLPVQVQDCIEMVSSSRGISYIRLEDKSDPNALIAAEPDLLNLAIINILENAVKYGKKNPEVLVRIDNQKERVNLIISDKGIGIPPKDLPHIFERFYRVDKARTRKLGGAGLGLSIVKIIIEKLSGTISVDSKLDVGTTFTLSFPVMHDPKKL